MNIEEVVHAHIDGGEGLLALVVRPENPYPEGVQFATPPAAGMQVGFMRRAAGHVVAPHVHPARPREVRATQEVLFVKSGLVRADFYSSRGEYADSRHLGPGDVLVLLAGGHGLYCLKDTEMAECKIGPFMGKDIDKVMLPLRASARGAEA
jgi:hypothetical protein